MQKPETVQIYGPVSTRIASTTSTKKRKKEGNPSQRNAMSKVEFQGNFYSSFYVEFERTSFEEILTFSKSPQRITCNLTSKITVAR